MLLSSPEVALGGFSLESIHYNLVQKYSKKLVFSVHHSTLLNRLQTLNKKCCAFAAKQREKPKKFWCVFATYSTVCIPLNSFFEVRVYVVKIFSNSPFIPHRLTFQDSSHLFSE